MFMPYNECEIEEMVRRAQNPEYQDVLQYEIDSQFSDIEQSVLWQCMENKPDSIQQDLSAIVRRNWTSSVPETMYRGISKKTMATLDDKGIGSIIKFDRVMSFSPVFGVARNFASYNFYGTFNMFCIKDAPSCEFNGAFPEATRRSNARLISDECEFMLPIGTTLRVDSIIQDGRYTIWNLSIVSY
ncbi:NAD--protein ADP-ribosyltransferase [Escherichia phage vB_EcoM-ZQ3]|uniref:NAD--protein ADP-ribosyltransferase n=1 Tax=Escherichia phage vB_EcoM-ZQ3 TaxID=2810369 RepID=A0A8F3C7Q0_9CAUD|nr:NAD--protein ADP-ribosyltransferase [Escherichia phage vB_EcoM-ZQ3]